MFYGISQSTDMRCKNTIVKKFTSERALKRWLGYGSGNYTYEDPEQARNYHHTFKYGYEFHGRVDKKDPIFKDFGSSTYPRTTNDNLASYIYQHGRKITDS